MYAYSEIFKLLEGRAGEQGVFFDTSFISSGSGSFAVSICISSDTRKMTRVSRLGTVESDGKDVIAVLQEEVTVAALSEFMGFEVPVGEDDSEPVADIADSGFKASEEDAEIPAQITTKPLDFMPEPKTDSVSETTMPDAEASEAHTGDDFMVTLGKYKVKGAWFSEVLTKDKDTIRRLLRVPNPTSPDMKSFQEKAKAYLGSRDIDISVA